MKNALILHIPNNLSDAIDYLLLDEHKNIKTSLSKIQTSELAAIIKNHDIYVIVPGNDVFLTEITLPKLSIDKLEKAIPYALEEKLAEDITDLHFAIGEIHNNGLIHVAVVSKKKMNEWKSRITDFFLPHHAVTIMFLPETLALPWYENTWTAFIDNTKFNEKRAVVRTGHQSGFAIEESELWPLLLVLLKNPKTIHPKKIIIFGDYSLQKDNIIFLNQLNISIEQRASIDFATCMETSFNENTTINLLQGLYKINYSTLNRMKLYLTIGIFIGALLFIDTFGYIAQFYILKNNENNLNEQIISEFKKTHPSEFVKIEKISDIIRQEIIASKSGAVKNIFLETLKNVSPILRQSSIKILELSYENKQLVLIIETTDLSSLENLVNLLKIKKFRVAESEVIKLGMQIHAKLTIEESI
jgi:general secretion pathway protein L